MDVTKNSDCIIACEVCEATAVIEDVPADRNPLPSGWTAHIDDSSPFMYDRTVYRCGECSAKAESNDNERDERFN